MIKLKGYFLLVFILCTVGIAYGDCMNCIPIVVDVAPRLDERRESFLSVKLRNTGGKNLVIRNTYSPFTWEGQHKIKLMAMNLTTGAEVVNKLSSSAHVLPKDISIDGGASAQEEIRVEFIFPELADEIKKGEGDIIVFWTYQLNSDNVGQSERFGGWVVFPQKK